MRLTYLTRTGLLASATPILVGCGFVFSHGPPDNHQQLEYFSCTESNTGPILDVVWGSLNVLGALAAAGDPDAYTNSDQIILVGLTWGAVSGAAAAVGFNKSRKCRDAKLELARRQPMVAQPTQMTADSTLAAVVLRPQLDTLLVGDQLQLVATAHNSSGAAIPNRSFVWSSSNDAIASVNRAGMVTAHASGSVAIAANAEGIVGTTRIVVVQPN
jgi:hypothetical protein